MTRIVSVFAALFASVLLFTAAAGHAQAPTGPYYIATPVAAPAKTTLITHTTVWRLNNASLVANKAPERDTVLCELVARNVGQLSAFTAGGQTFDADALAKCNARAK